MTVATPTPENKRIAHYVAAAFGGTPDMTQYDHGRLPLKVYLLSCADRPAPPLVSYSTIGLSDFPMLNDDGTEFPARIEISGVCAKKDTQYGNVLAAVALSVMRTNRLIYRGVVLRGFVAGYFPSTTVPHLYFASPFLWKESLKPLDCGTKRVSWLLAVPISESESGLADQSDDKVEAMLEQRGIDMHDLWRPSTV